MKHVVQYSGGVGSWATATRVIDRHGLDDVVLMFSDTLIEDEDLYRFLLETWQDLSGVDLSGELEFARDLPPIEDDPDEVRVVMLKLLAEQVVIRVPMVRWIIEGRDPWEVFEDTRYIGNTRIDPCSRLLKRELLWRHIAEEFDPDDTVIYFGIDWTEEHRIKGVRSRKPEWVIEAPLCEPPLYAKARFQEELVARGIEVPRLYHLGFPHNNCGGFCVKAGQAHFVHLLKTMPERYRYHEEREAKLSETLDGATILRERKKGPRAESVGAKPGDLLPLFEAGAKQAGRYVDPRTGEEIPRAIPMSLRELRERVEAGDEGAYDPDDWGGCGCALE